MSESEVMLFIITALLGINAWFVKSLVSKIDSTYQTTLILSERVSGITNRLAQMGIDIAELRRLETEVSVLKSKSRSQASRGHLPAQ